MCVYIYKLFICTCRYTCIPFMHFPFAAMRQGGAWARQQPLNNIREAYM